MARNLFLFFLLVSMLAVPSSCETASIASSTTYSGQPELFDTTMKIPDYHKQFWRGYTVFDSVKGRFIDASVSDQDILKKYPYWIGKGELSGKTRVSILTSKTVFKIGEPVRVAHVIDETEKGRTLFIMGPKEISNEFVSDSIPFPPPVNTPLNTDYPWIPIVYDGAVLNSPGIDYNFEITEYRFEKPGKYYIQWFPGKFSSNMLTIIVE